VIAITPEVATMFLDTSALYLLERHRAFEAELERDGLLARQRAEVRHAKEATAEAAQAGSGGVVDVVAGDGPNRRRDLRPDLGRTQHLDPTPCTEQHTGRFVRPIHP
jgi:hypothetical protein